ncbi:hypothetical protein H7J06_08515 [Mycobacterium hodleri]|uniref:hypothetical protein n=1 Tax=Mycolicibacterium hodleri TaxID=49897 RepID=UPI000AF0C71C|nr:hypothetical protein [Mycolicibacterium hodleri]MCV7133031.1 hypothetical protein [Mycolicibacterium hodleri]
MTRGSPGAAPLRVDADYPRAVGIDDESLPAPQLVVPVDDVIACATAILGRRIAMSTAPRTASIIESAVAHGHAPSGTSQFYLGSIDHT